MDATDRTYTAEQQEILQLLRDAVNAAKQLHAAMDAISFELSQEYASKTPAPVAQASDTGWKEAAIAWEVCASLHRQYCKGKDPLFTTRQNDFVKHAADAREHALQAQDREDADLVEILREAAEIIAAPVAAQVQPQQSENQEALADTQRAIIEAAELRGYERAIAECGQDRKDAERYRLLRRGKHWGIINAAGDPLRTDVLDAAIDAARAQQEGQS